MDKRNRKEHDKKYRESNIEKCKESSKKYYEANLEKIKERRKKYKEENPEKIKEYYKKYREANSDKIKNNAKKSILTIDDRYAKSLLKLNGFPKESITPELIEVKRIILKTKRL